MFTIVCGVIILESLLKYALFTNESDTVCINEAVREGEVAW